MNFQFTEDQLAFRDSFKGFLEEACPTSVVRAAWETRPDELWGQLAEMGLLAVELPESLGGLEMQPVDMVLLWEESGYAALPVPFLDATVLAPLLPDELAEAVGSGEKRVALGARGWDADCAHAVVVGDQLSTDFSTVPRKSVDGARRLFDVTLNDAQTIRDPADRAALAASAQLLGLGRRMLDIAVDYGKVRRQFGKPIGSFQAVQNHLADALLQLEFAAPLVYQAAATMKPLHIHMAKAAATEAAHVAGRKALQCHGAIGYCIEHDLHLFLKRSWALERSFGSAAWHLEHVAAEILDA
jgi:alkylation response protein AidB-like acyl-CoA dehydrogenase